MRNTKTLLVILGVFAGTYMGLVAVYRLGTVATWAAGALLLLLGMGFLFKSAGASDSRTHNTLGISAGIFLWGFIGEVMERLEVLQITSWHMLPLLGLITFVVIKRFLPDGLMFCWGAFTAIWVLHFMMINQYEHLGRSHWTTYPVCALFLTAVIYSGFRMTKAKGVSESMAYALTLLLTSWTVLEYVWGWRWIPGPWMVHG